MVSCRGYRIYVVTVQIEVAIAMQILIAIIALSWALYYIVSAHLVSRRNAAKARALKCEEPPLLKNRYPFGIDQLLRVLAADRAKEYPTFLIRRSEEVGSATYKVQMLGNTVFQTADPKNIQQILATRFSDFDVGANRVGNFDPMLGSGIFTHDGSLWQHDRALLRPQFSRDQLSDLDLEETHVQNMMKLLDISLESNGWIEKVDLQPFFFRLTFDSSTEFLFGESINSQSRLIPGYQSKDTNRAAVRPAEFETAFDFGQTNLAVRARLASNFWVYNTKAFRDACKAIHEFADHFVRLALSDDAHAADGKEKYIFLKALAATTKDPSELRYQVLHVLLAGRDTTASLLGWVFLCLSRDPGRYKKLRDAIIADFGTYTNPAEITFTKLKNCKYLQYVNNETLRLYPIVPLNSREANKDTTLPRGGGKDGNSPVFVPKGSLCEYSVHVMHRCKDIWGPDADEFIPERWEGRVFGWEYLPFNGGPRICLGQQFALTEASYVTVRLIQRFDRIESLDRDVEVRHNHNLVNNSSNGVNVRLHVA